MVLWVVANESQFLKIFQGWLEGTKKPPKRWEVFIEFKTVQQEVGR